MMNHAIRFIGADDGSTIEELLCDYLSLQQEAANERTSSDRLIELATIGTDLARRVARNPSAPPELLRKLANSKDATTRSHVAANPNSPTEVLLHLGCKFPEQLLDNPIFSLLWLENPNLVHEMPFTTLVKLLQQEQVPVLLLEQAASHSDREVQLAVTMNGRTPRTALEKLVQCGDAQVAESAQLHVQLAGEMTDSWDEAANKAIQTTVLHPRNQNYIKELAKIGLVPEFIVDRLPRNWYGDKFLEAVASGVNNLPHTEAAKHSHTSMCCLELLAKHEDIQVRANLAKNPNTPESLLEILAKDKTIEVRCGVVQNPNTSEKLLKQLLGDRTWKVRLVAMAAYLAQNPDALPVVLEHQLAKKSQEWEYYTKDSTSSFIRLLILLHPQIPGKALAENSRSEAWLERYAIAKAPNTPIDILHALAVDANRIVRATAKANLQSHSKKP